MITSYFSCGSYNLAAWLLSGRDRKKNLLDTEIRVKDLLDKYGVLGLQEAGSAEYKEMIKDLCKNGDYDYYWGPGDGAAMGMRSTPIVWRTHSGGLNAVDFKTVKLTRGVRIPLGAGPPMVKPKFAHSVTFKVTRPSDSKHELGEEHGGARYVNFINIHGLASLWVPLRAIWARKFFSRLGKAIEELDGLVILVGDFNCKPDSRHREPLFKAGMRSLQQVKGPLVTYPPNGIIDDIMFRTAPRRLMPQAVLTRNGPSDHHAVIGVFNLLFKD